MVTTLKALENLANHLIDELADQCESKGLSPTSAEPAVAMALGTAIADFARSREGSPFERRLAMRLSDIDVLHRLFIASSVHTGAQTAAVQTYSNLSDRLVAEERRIAKRARRDGTRNPRSWASY